MPKQVTVAAAVLEQADGRYLLARRAPGAVYAGYWEFPGGKVEEGETPWQAIVRELDEELGIRVERADPWLRRAHLYEHAQVDLHFFRIRAWHGEVQDRVHDRLSWQRPGDELVSPMLPANGPILASLALPPHYAITQAARIGTDAQLGALAHALAGGLRLVQLREPELPEPARVAFYRAALGQCHAAGARALIHADVALAVALRADGVHLPARMLGAFASPPGLSLLAASCHDAAELSQAAALGCDFAVLGPVNATASHPGQAGIGWSGFSTACGAPPCPVYALGGIAPGDLDRAWRHGAHGVAGIRAFWEENP